MLPSQLPVRGNYLNTPEMHLVAAIFEDAVNCVLRNVGVRRGPRWREFLSARDWILDDRRDWPFTFANICELLTLDPVAVRESLHDALSGDRSGPDGSTPARERTIPAPPRPRRLSSREERRGRQRRAVVLWDEA